MLTLVAAVLAEERAYDVVRDGLDIADLRSSTASRYAISETRDEKAMTMSEFFKCYVRRFQAGTAGRDGTIR